MPRPITKQDIEHWNFFSDLVKIKKDRVLGIVLMNSVFFAYSTYNDGSSPIWVSEKTFRKRQKIGHPSPRKKPVKLRMAEGPFSLDEMALAESIMDQMD